MGCVQVPTMIASNDDDISGPWQKGRGGRGPGLVKAKDEDDELLRSGFTCCRKAILTAWSFRR